MRVLYVIAHFPQNSESYVEAEMKYVRKMGARVAVWSPVAGFGDPQDVVIYRSALDSAIANFHPDVIHVHHMTTAAYYLSRLPKNGVTTIRAHSFDWDDELAVNLANHPAVRKVFAFPHLSRRVKDVYPLEVAYDPELYYRESDKDKNSVVRLAAGLPTKRLEDFVTIGNQLFPYANFTLAMTPVIGKETVAIDEMIRLNQSMGGYVRIVTGLSRAKAAELVRRASVYLSTYDPKSHEFGMPISIAEAMATGALVVCPKNPAAEEYVGSAGRFYSSVDEAKSILLEALKFSDKERGLVADVACDRAYRFRSDVVLPRLLEEWSAICLENF
jgi:glycosyltransferase involved in cell wall biosynthesis